MKTTGSHNYYVYITTNKNKTVLYTGVTNNLAQRLQQHLLSIENNGENFTARYNVCNLIYWEYHTNIKLAIAREKEIKGWVKSKKVKLIESMNPDWRFLNDDVL